MAVPQRDLAPVRPGEGEVDRFAVVIAADFGDGWSPVDLGADDVFLSEEGPVGRREPLAGVDGVGVRPSGGRAAKGPFAVIA